MDEKSIEAVLTDVLLKSFHQIALGNNLQGTVNEAISQQLAGLVASIMLKAIEGIDKDKIADQLKGDFETAMVLALDDAVRSMAARVIVSARNVSVTDNNINAARALINAELEKRHDQH